MSFALRSFLPVALALAVVLAGCSTSRTEVGGENDLPLARAEQSADGLARCKRRLGTVAITEADTNAQALSSAGLPRSMAPLVRHMLTTTRCFTVVDRGAAFELLERERKLRESRGIELPPASRTLKTVDYVLRAEIVFAEQTQGAKGLLGGLFGSVIGGVGAEANRKEAVVLLSFVDAGTSEIVSSTFGRGASNSTGIGQLVLAGGAVLLDGGWADTPEAKTVAAALVDAWNRSQPKLVNLAAEAAARNAAAPVAAPAASASASASAAGPVVPAAAASSADPSMPR